MSRVLSMLNQFVETKGRTKGNTFYVEEVDEEELGGRHMRVYSKEDRSVIFITPPYDAEYFLSDWVYAQRRIDLLKDIVETEEDRGTTNFLVARPWVKKDSGTRNEPPHNSVLKLGPEDQREGFDWDEEIFA